ncbi:MAG: hypothetical protein OK456_05895, partial [Thaumarchaeota archaeon]|nr:hypothetical protein [Nitrososphaerota archaeon]
MSAERAPREDRASSHSRVDETIPPALTTAVVTPSVGASIDVRHSLGRTFTVFSQTDQNTIQRQALPDEPDEPGKTECDEPRSMIKVTRGAFKGGKKLEDYYGGASGRWWAHGGTAGPFDTGTHAGANVQLIGTVASPCKPETFHLKQWVSVTKDRRSGSKYAGSDEGRSFEDAPVPVRQTWLGDPPGLNISSADAPAADYKTNPGSSLELDR